MTRITAVLLLFGVVILVGLVIHIGPLTLVGELQQLGTNFLWVLLPSIAVYIFDAYGWRATLGRHAHRLSMVRLFTIRMAGEAVNFTTPSAYLGGEPMKAYLLSRYQVPLVEGMASVVTAKTTMTLAQVLFILMGVGFAWPLVHRSRDLIVISILGVAMLGFGLGLFLVVQHRGLFMGILRLLERAGLRIRWPADRESRLQALDDAIRDFYRRDRQGFARSFGFFFIGWVTGAMEVWLILYFLGQHVDMVTAFTLEAMAVFVKGSTSFIPGSIGGQEAGSVLLFAAFGYPPAVGVTFAIVRRVREIIWIVVGLMALAIENRRAYQPESFGRPPL
jgi:putative membrane protein